jgi:hypothetical protein
MLALRIETEILLFFFVFFLKREIQKIVVDEPDPQGNARK